MAAGEPGIKAPLHPKVRNTSIVLLFILALALVYLVFKPDYTYRIRWNPYLATAIVEEYGIPKTGGIDWFELIEFDGPDAGTRANEYLDKKIEKKRKQKTIDTQWVVIRKDK